MEITAGLFALGGVAMTALLGDAWRESRNKQTAELKTLRREMFNRKQVESGERLLPGGDRNAMLPRSAE
jgi:hypothetical protein